MNAYRTVSDNLLRSEWNRLMSEWNGPCNLAGEVHDQLVAICQECDRRKLAPWSAAEGR